SDKTGTKNSVRRTLASGLQPEPDTDPSKTATDVPTIFVITPTYARHVQKAELTRMDIRTPRDDSIDSKTKTPLVTRFLKNCGVSYTHLNAPTPPDRRPEKYKSRHKVSRGVNQRNTGLRWLRQHANETKRGVVFFGDDDNTYDLQLFEEMRHTKTVSAWPVAFVGGVLVERPLLGEDGKVAKWSSVHKPERPYPMDMAAFAINLQLILDHPDAEFSYTVPPGYQESTILQKVQVPLHDLEIKADQGTKVLVWHTRSAPLELASEKKLKVHSNVNIEV
ncbi:unnamed protein product, partial [Notodromas monacha]